MRDDLSSDLTDRMHKKPHSLPNLVGKEEEKIYPDRKFAVSPFPISETAQTAKIYWLGPTRAIPQSIHEFVASTGIRVHGTILGE